MKLRARVCSALVVPRRGRGAVLNGRHRTSETTVDCSPSVATITNMSSDTLNFVGSWASIVGLVLAAVGFFVTIIGVWKSKSAAERAASAATQARDNMIVLHTVDDFATAVAAMEEIKRLHRADAWVALPDRYSDLRKRLVMLRATYGELSDLDRAVIQGTVQHLVTLETKVERALAAGAAPNNVPKMNEIVSQQLDKLSELLAIVKARPRN